MMIDAATTANRLKRLTDGQIQCLILVDQHLSSKEIGARLSISPHTVDQRIRLALQALEVSRRGEAARMVAAAAPYCARIQSEYQRLIHQSPHIEPAPAPVQSEATVSSQIRHADRAGEVRETGPKTEQGSDDRPLLLLPFATRRQPRNEMGVGMRLFWILAIAMGSAFSIGAYLAGLESLSRLLSR